MMELAAEFPNWAGAAMRTRPFLIIVFCLKSPAQLW